MIFIAVPVFAQDEGDGGGSFSGGGFSAGGFGGGFDEGDSTGIDGPALGSRSPKVDPLADIRTWLTKAGAPSLEKSQVKPLNKLYERELKLLEKSFESQFGVSLESALAAERSPARGRRGSGGRATNPQETAELHRLLDHLSDLVIAGLRMDQQAALRKYQSEQLRVKRIALMKQKLTAAGLALTPEQESQLDAVYSRESRLRTLAIVEAKGEPYDKTVSLLEKQTSQRVVQLLNQTQKAILSAALSKTKTTTTP